MKEEKDFDKPTEALADGITPEQGPRGPQERVPSAEAEAAFSREATGEAGYVPLDRLCVECYHAAKPAIGGWNYANCTSPTNPINLVTGRRVFPCVIARGFDQLCGWQGKKWEKR